MFQLYLLHRGVWIESGEPFGNSRKNAIAQLPSEYVNGTWKLRKVR